MDKVAGVEWTLASRHGAFEFFGLIRREDAKKWDVVVSAAWLPDESGESIGTIVDALKAAVGGDGMTAFSRVIVLPRDSDFVADLHDVYRRTEDRRRVDPGQYGRVDVADGYLFKAVPIEPMRPISFLNISRGGRVA